MISHKFYNVVLEIGSLKVYYLWGSPDESVPITQNFYWHDKKCEKSIGPFASLAEAMTDYAAAKRTEKALQRRGFVKGLQLGEPSPHKAEYPKGRVDWKHEMAVWDPDEHKMKMVPIRGKNGR